MKKPIIRLASMVLLLAIITLAFRVPNTNIRRNRFHVPELGGSIIVGDIPASQSIEINVDRRAAVLQLNQRKLTRAMKQIRFDSRKALELLGSAYQHLAIPPDEMHTNDEMEWSYEQLVDILYRDNGVISDAEPVVIDGKSTSMAIEVLCRARNVSAAMILLKRSVDGVIYNRQLREKCQEQTSALWQDEESDNNELCTIYKSILSMLGRAQSQSTSSYAERQQTSAVYSSLTLHLLREHIPSVAQIQPGLQLYHAALNSLGRHGSHDAITKLLNDMKDPSPDKMAYQIAISSLAKCGECLDATQLLHQMRGKGFSPDIVCYNELLIGIARQAGRHQSGKKSGQDPISWHKLALEILKDIESQRDLATSITDQTYNSIISACGKEKAWEAASLVASKASNCTISKNSIDSSENDEQTSSYFSNLDTFHKNGRGNDAWWEIAEYNCGERSIIVGIQPHRNPKRNGMSLVFYRDDLEGNRVKVGRLLLKNDRIPSSMEFYFSSIIGMEVNSRVRGEGLSKVLVAIWLDICLQTECFPRAAMMNKPLISLVLSKFGFIPDDGGCKCVLVRLEDGDDEHTFGLYSPQKSLDGALSHRVLRIQNIKLLRMLPDSSRQKGAEVVIKTTFRHPHKPPDGNRDSDEVQVERILLKDKINAALNLTIDTDMPTSGSGSGMKYCSSKDKLSKAFLFF
eukprot:scaffold4410_cov127-Skeletonema_marinoi.AAC.8